MKKFLTFIIIVGLLVFGAWKFGWIGVSNTESTTIVTFDKDKAKADTDKAIEKGKEAGEKLMEKGKEAGEKIKEGAKDIKDKVTEKKEAPAAEK